MEPKSVGRFGKDAVRDIHEVSGLVAGAVIMTLEGEMPIQFLSPGDRVVTRDTGMAVVKAVRPRKMVCDAVAIMAGSLGHTRPDRDVVVPAGQKILIRDWRAEALYGQKQAMIPASKLVDGEFVTLHQNVEITFYEIEFDREHVIYADGLEVASYVSSDIYANAA